MSPADREKRLKEAAHKEQLADDVDRCPGAYQGSLLRAAAKRLREEANG